MEPSDLTLEILRDIREDIRGLRQSTEAFQQRQEAFNEVALQRFETIETALVDFAAQLLMQSRAIRSLIQSRPGTEARLDELAERVSALEARVA